MEKGEGRKHCSVSVRLALHMFSSFILRAVLQGQQPREDSDLHLVRVRFEVGSVRH